MASKIILLEYNGRGTPIIDDLARFLDGRKHQVFLVSHPLSLGDSSHSMRQYGHSSVRQSSRFIPNRPPITYFFDLLWPIRYPSQIQIWFAFTNLAALKGIFLRRLGRVEKCVYYAIDFTPNRFGKRSLLTVLYRITDRFVSKRVNIRVDLSQAQQIARNRDLRLEYQDHQVIIPVGLWPCDDYLTKPPNTQDRYITYFGNLSAAQGVQYLPRILRGLHDKGLELKLRIIGTGTLKTQLEKEFLQLGLSSSVDFCGYIADRSDVMKILSSSWLGLAPYSNEIESWVSTTDSGKFKAYLEVGLPFITTRISTSADELASRGCAVAVDLWSDFVDGIEELANDDDKWNHLRDGALRIRDDFDWNRLFGELMHQIDSVC